MSILRSSSLFRFRNVAYLASILLCACVIKLTDRNSPADNGGVTGPPADCAQERVLPGGAFGGAAEPKLLGRFAVEPSEEGQPPNPPFFDWSGSSITIRFQNTEMVTIKLVQTGAVPQDQMFEFVVDDLEPTARRLAVKLDPAGNPTNTPQEDYPITGLVKNAAHEVVVYKNTEAQKGSIIFKGFDLHGGTILPPTRRARRIEFIGDSIMCGYGNEGKNATCPFEVEVRKAPGLDGGAPTPVTVPVTQNQYLAFTAIAARALDADAVTTCWSGKGVYLNYKERARFDPVKKQFVPEDDATTTMPELWATRTIANDFEGYKWDFTKEKPEEVPQVVVISLGTNDFARDTLPLNEDPAQLPGDNIPDENMNNEEELRTFYEKYGEHVAMVRANRPTAHIFLATPPMVTDQFPLDNARKKLRATLDQIVSDHAQKGDNKVYAMDLVEQGFRYGLGCDYHPNLEVHRVMAKQLVGAIKSKTCW